MSALPMVLRRPVSPLCPKHILEESWRAYEFAQWMDAVRHRHMNILSLDAEVQKAVLRVLADRPDRRALNP